MKRVPIVLAAILTALLLAAPAQTQQNIGTEGTLRLILKQLAVLNQSVLSLRLTGISRPAGLPSGNVDVYVRNAVDPCGTTNKGNVAISQTATSRLVAGLSGRTIYICSARVVAGAAEIASFTEGTGTTCGTGETAVSGSTTAANGESYAANGGFAEASNVALMATTKPGDDLCLKQSTSNRLAGNITYAYVP